MTKQYLYEWDATKFYQKGHKVVFRGNTYISNCDNNTGAPEHMKRYTLVDYLIRKGGVKKSDKGLEEK